MQRSNKSPGGAADGLSDKAVAWLGLTMTRSAQPRPCPSAEDIVSWHDGSLSPAQSDAIQSHVAHCESCHAAWMNLVAFDDSARAPAPARPHGYWPAVTALFRQPAFAAAAVASVLALAVWQYYDTQVILPGYQMALQAGAEIRGNDPREPGYRYREGHVFELMLTPETSTDEGLEVALFSFQRGTTTTIDLPSVERSPAGVVLIEGQVGRDIQFPPGRSRLLIVIAASGRLPSATVLHRQLQDREVAENAAWSAWAVDVEFTE